MAASFNGRFREVRLERHMTLTCAAALLGLRTQYLSNYELGKRKPSPAILCRMASLYHVSIDYLLGYSDDPKSDMPRFPEKLERLMRARHLSTEGLAAKIGVSPEIIATLLGDGYLDAPLSLIKKICLYFGVSLDYLADD